MTPTTPSITTRPGTCDLRIPVLEAIARRALVHCAHMIWEANHRGDAAKGAPKVGGHPASCASSLHLATALHMVARYPSDYYCAKPHLAPMDHVLQAMLGFLRRPDGSWMARDEIEGTLHRLRAFSSGGEPVFQSYHAASDPDSWRILPSGSVGLPPVASAYLALAYDYAKDHGYEIRGRKNFWSLIGDSEFREGSIAEALPDIAERELGNVTWIVDYNRQNLDGTRIPNSRGLHGNDADRIERTARANGWEVIQIRHGRKRDALFQRQDGELFRDFLDLRLSDYEYQAMLWKRDPAVIRGEMLERQPRLKRFLSEVEDADLLEAFADLGGHDFVRILKAFESARADMEVPVLIVAHTVKGWGLDSYAAPGNHSAVPDREEILRLLESEGLSPDAPYALEAGAWKPGGPEITFLERRGEELRQGITGSLERKEQNGARVAAKLASTLPLPEDFGLNVAMVPYAHTQWAWGQIAGKLVRVGTRDELEQVGQDPGRELTELEKCWAEAADFCLTMSPDVGTSTNINPAMDAKIYGPALKANVEAELDFRGRGRPELYARLDPWTRHIRFEIAEANCMSAAGAFGKIKDYTGVPFLPMMTVYDFFIKRALDQLFYNLYWGSSFLLLGTPSGVTLSPEGAQHSWKSDIQIPGLITWEPAFAKEMEWIIADAIRRHLEGDHDDRNGVLIRAVTRGIRQKEFLERLRTQARFQGDGEPLPDADILAAVRRDVLAGGYRLADRSAEPGYAPGENVVTILAMGAVVPEALEASDRLLEIGIHADVLVVTCPDLLLGRFAERDGYRQLKEGLGQDGALHLTPPLDGGGLDAGEARLLNAARVPIVSVADGEPGLLDNAGSILGVRQIALAVRKFSKSGRPEDIYPYQGLDARSIFEACGRALSESALGTVRVDPAALDVLKGGTAPRRDWRELWPYSFN